jgi:glycosyltransferase involved in cell wall biosynthesis
LAWSEIDEPHIVLKKAAPNGCDKQPRRMAGFLKILNVMLSQGPGGVQSAHAGYAKLLRSLGHRVSCCIAPNAFVGTLLPTDMPVLILPNMFEFDPVAIGRAAMLLRRQQPDVIFVHGKRALMIFSWARRFVGRHIPIVCVLHRHRFRKLAAADVIVCVSEALRAEAIDHGVPAERLVYVPNFITDTAPTPRAQLWRKPPVIGFLGRLMPVKGVDLLIEALAALKSSGVQFAVRIGGDGAQRRAMVELAYKNQLSDHIQWLGWVDDLQAFYESIDILCVPSRAESFGLVILDAFHAGKPVVATRTTGPLSLIADKQNGLLCDQDAREIAMALKVLIENPGLGQRLVTQANQDLDRYKIDSVAPQVDALLRKLVVEDDTGPKPSRSTSAIGVAN